MRGAGHQSPSQGNGAREFLRERRGAGRSDGESAHSRPGCSAGVSPRPRSFASPTRPFAEIGRIPRQDRFSSGSRSVPPRGYSSRERRRRAGRRRSGMFTMSENVFRRPGAVEPRLRGEPQCDGKAGRRRAGVDGADEWHRNATGKRGAERSGAGRPAGGPVRCGDGDDRRRPCSPPGVRPGARPRRNARSPLPVGPPAEAPTSGPRHLGVGREGAQRQRGGAGNE